MKRLRGSSARLLFSSDTSDAVYKAELLVFTDEPSADVHLNSQNNCDTQVPQKSDAMQSDSISQTPHERDIQEMYAILPDVLKTLEESGTKNPSWIFVDLFIPTIFHWIILHTSCGLRFLGGIQWKTHHQCVTVNKQKFLETWNEDVWWTIHTFHEWT